MTHQNLSLISLPANSDLSAKQYYCVSVNSSGNAILATAAKNCIGILQNDPLSGEASTIAVSGKSYAAITDTIAIGAPLEITTGGTLINNASGTVVAFALEAGTTGSTIAVLITPNNALLA